jgi:hypothetical protein
MRQAVLVAVQGSRHLETKSGAKLARFGPRARNFGGRQNAPAYHLEIVVGELRGEPGQLRKSDPFEEVVDGLRRIV